MKYAQLFLGLLCFIGILILYFQMLIFGNYTMPFFSTYIDINIFAMFLITLAFLSGMLITLAIKGFMSGSSTIDDDFDL